MTLAIDKLDGCGLSNAAQVIEGTQDFSFIAVILELSTTVKTFSNKALKYKANLSLSVVCITMHFY